MNVQVAHKCPSFARMHFSFSQSPLVQKLPMNKTVQSHWLEADDNYFHGAEGNKADRAVVFLNSVQITPLSGLLKNSCMPMLCRGFSEMLAMLTDTPLYLSQKTEKLTVYTQGTRYVCCHHHS